MTVTTTTVCLHIAVYLIFYHIACHFNNNNDGDNDNDVSSHSCVSNIFITLHVISVTINDGDNDNSVSSHSCVSNILSHCMSFQ